MTLQLINNDIFRALWISWKLKLQQPIPRHLCYVAVNKKMNTIRRVFLSVIYRWRELLTKHDLKALIIVSLEHLFFQRLLKKALIIWFSLNFKLIKVTFVRNYYIKSGIILLQKSLPSLRYEFMFVRSNRFVASSCTTML